MEARRRSCSCRSALSLGGFCDLGAVGGQGVVGHGDRVAGVQPVVAVVPVNGAARRTGAAPPSRRARAGGAFVGVAHPPHFREPLRPGQIGARLGEHAPARLDRGQLVSRGTTFDQEIFPPRNSSTLLGREGVVA